ncbi:MAG: heavy-metal-associated domain-containing protein [Steroidobacteraceae bacterium]
MKTSAIEVHEMLSVFSVDEVEKRIGEVPGVQSVTVNFAAGNATVRYDETLLEATDIKSAVRQRGFDPAAGAAGDGDEGKAAAGAPPAGIAPAPPDAPASPAVAGVSPPDKAAVPAAPESLTAESPAAGDEPKDKAAPQKS